MLIFSFFSILAKFIAAIFSLFNLGSGTTLISNLYLKYFKNTFNIKSFTFKKGVIFVTGTNGKSTTSKLLADILRGLNFKVLHNETGGNIFRSIVGMFLLNKNFFFKNKYDYLVLEIDEASIYNLSKYVKPTHLIILNFSRDQLDRYFEIENISENIIYMLNSSKNIKLIYNLEDSYCLDIAKSIPNEKLGYKKDLDILKHSSYTEEFMASNLSAVSVCLSDLGINKSDFLHFLKDLKKPYGRGEKIVKGTTEFELHLAKNPSSFNSNLIELAKRKNLKYFLVILNDEQPDGRDISWIYDIEPELLNDLLSKKKIIFSGTRAFEMANRIKYAVKDFNLLYTDRNLKECFVYLNQKEINELVILCNYSAMLQTRKILTGKNIL